MNDTPSGMPPKQSAGEQGSAPRPPSIELRNILKYFAGVPAVAGISLSVQQGEFLTLLGPSGCGKTTTLRMVAGFERPSAGEILIAGRSVTNLPPNRRNVNTVFQNYALFPHMNVAANVGFGLKMQRLQKKEIDRRVAEALALVRLESLGRRRPSQLSGGQQQRVALARALVNRPAVLLLDEPLGALDLKLRRAMQLELRHLNRSVGITFIYVTHDQEEALTMSDRIAVMSGGRILQLDTPHEIYERPATRFVADFIGESNFLEGAILRHEDDQAVVSVPGVGDLRAHVRLGAPTARPEASDSLPPSFLATGTPISLAIRPERISIEALSIDSQSPDAEHNSVAGRLTEIVYAGSEIHSTVQVGDHTLVVHSPNLGLPSLRAAAQSAGMSSFRADSRSVGMPSLSDNEVRLRWAVSDCVVLLS